MGYGLQVFNDSGVQVLGPDTRLTRVLHEQYLPSSGSGYVDVPGFNSTDGVAFAIAINSVFHAPHEISTSGERIYWSVQDPQNPIACYLYVLMYQ